MKQGLCGTGVGGGGAGNPGTSGVDYALTYAPGSGADGAAVFDSWTDLYIALQDMRSAAGGDMRARVIIDDRMISPAVIPPGTYDMSNVVLSGIGRTGGFGVGIAEIPEGVIFQELKFFESVQIINRATATSPITAAPGDIYYLSDYADISNPGAVPFIDATAFDFNANFDFMTFQLRGESSFGRVAGGVVLDVGNGGLLPQIYGGRLDSGTIAGGAGAYMQLEAPYASALLGIQSGFTGYIDRLGAGGTRGPRIPYALETATRTSAHTIAINGFVDIVDATAGSFNVTLPTIPGTLRDIHGKLFFIKEVSGANSVDLLAGAGNTLNDGTSPYTIPAGGGVIVMTDGNSKYQIISEFGAAAASAINDEMGWASYLDGTYTSASPLSLLSGVVTQLPNDGATVIDSFAPVGSAAWLTAAEFTPDQLGDMYFWQLEFTIDPTLNNRNLLIEIDVNGTAVWTKTTRLARGAGVDTRINERIEIPVDTALLTNGASINLTVDGDSSVFDIKWTLHRAWRA